MSNRISRYYAASVDDLFHGTAAATTPSHGDPSAGQDGGDAFGEPIYSYTRRQAVEDGVIVPLSGPLYPADGDAWVPAMVAEAGFRLPVYMNGDAFCALVCPVDGEGEQLAPGQDPQGRLWDVLNLAAAAMRRNRSGTRAAFELRCRENVPAGSALVGRLRVQRLLIALSDEGDGPALVIFRPQDD